MSRVAFQKENFEGFNRDNLESFSISNTGDRIIVGTSDGGLVLYEVTNDTVAAIQGGGYMCREVEWIQRPTRVKPVTLLRFNYQLSTSQHFYPIL